jgi:hypothetical protein
MQTSSRPKNSRSASTLGFVILSIAKDLLFACAAIALCATATNAQTLARPGWVGSGLTPEPWWRHAVVYRIDGTQLPTLSQLPSLQAFGIDAVLLTTEAMQPPPAPTTSDANPAPDPPLTLDDLLFECSRLHIRVLIPLDVAPTNATPADTLALARSWLYRGAAGFVVSNLDKLTQTARTSPPTITPATTTPGAVHLHRVATHQQPTIHLASPAAEPQILADLRKLLTQFAGERILIGAASPTATPTLQLQIAVLTATPDPAQLTSIAAQTAPHPLLSLATTSAITPIDATRLLATTEPVILDSTAIAPDVLARVFPPLSKPVEPDAPAATAPPPPPPPASNVYGTFTPYIQKDTTAERRRKAAEDKAQKDAANIAADTFPVQPMYQPISETPEGYVAFYHRLIQLHRANATLHDGTLSILDTAPPAFAWTASHTGDAPLIVVCNPSSTPLKLDLTKSLQKLGGPHDMVRTLLHTAAASGVVNINQVAVPPNGVYIGELAHGYTYR